MTTNPLSAPLIIASLSIPATPSEEMLAAILDTIRRDRDGYSAADRQSILTAAERHPEMISSVIADALR